MGGSKHPNIGPGDFKRLASIVNAARLQAERLERNGFTDLARQLRDAAYAVANVDAELYTRLTPAPGASS